RGGPTGEEIFSRQHSSTIQFRSKLVWKLNQAVTGFIAGTTIPTMVLIKMMSEPTVCLTNIGPKKSHKRLVMGICIGILNHLFFSPEQYRRTGGMSIVFLFDENPDVASAGSGGAAVGGARSVPDHAARTQSERRGPAASVGNRFSAPQIVWNKSNRCAGERGGARVGRPR